jgi:hypothetical protein
MTNSGELVREQAAGKSEAQRDQAVERNAVDQLLNEVQHLFPSPRGHAVVFDGLILPLRPAICPAAFSPKPCSLSIKR